MSNDIIEIKDDSILYYNTDDDQLHFPVFFEDNTFGTTQKVMGRLFDVDIRTISEHLKNIFTDNELSSESTIRKFRIVQSENGRDVKRDLLFYNLDAIIAVGYRVNSKRATRFRQWATKTLHDYIMSNLQKSKDYKDMTEDEKRLAIRKEMTEHNKSLAEAAKAAGIVEPLDLLFFKMKAIEGFMAVSNKNKSMSVKDLEKAKEYLISWVARNWRRIFLEPPKPMRNFDAMALRENPKRMQCIVKSGRRFAKRSRSSAEQCRRTCRRQVKAYRKSNAKNKR
jgi:hypothetical protein